MRCAVDLHMHSCLSPCGDELMTPNNIVNMALLKGLHMIAVSDHNTARQLPAIERVAAQAGLALLPALELTTREEAHLLAYFPTVEQALALSERIYPCLPDIANQPALFGQQQLLDAEDEPAGVERKLLISALTLTIDELTEIIHELGGLAVPAHINRGNNGLLNALGFIPPDARFDALEVSRGLPMPHKGIPPLHRLYSSDAHRLEDIFEATEWIELEELTPEALLRWMKAPDRQ